MRNLHLRDLNKFKAALGLTMALSTSTVLSGCNETTVIEDATEIYDVIDSNEGEIEIEPQVLDVKGEDFKLIVKYDLDEDSSKRWRITDKNKGNKINFVSLLVVTSKASYFTDRVTSILHRLKFRQSLPYFFVLYLFILILNIFNFDSVTLILQIRYLY